MKILSKLTEDDLNTLMCGGTIKLNETQSIKIIFDKYGDFKDIKYIKTKNTLTTNQSGGC